MIILAYLTLLVVLLGMGVLVASILPTAGARIGLGTLVFLALVVDGTWFAAPLRQWSPWLADVVWLVVFGLVVAGALITALYYRREAGTWLWPSGRDLAFLTVVALTFAVIVWRLPVPLDTDAQGFGYLSLTLREGRDFTTLAPWHPEIDYLYSPGYIGLIAHLSARFNLSIPALQLAFSAAAALVFVWLAYDLGCELEGPRTGRGLMLAAVIGTGMITAFMDSHFTALLALDFSLGFITFVLRFLKTWRWSSALLAAICLGAVPLTQPDTTIALIIGYVPWLVVVWFSRPRPRFSAWLVIAAVIPLVALGIVSPWLLGINSLLGSEIESPFTRAATHWRTLVLMHGGVIVLLALLGALIGLRRRSPAQLLMITWLVAIVEFSTLGVLEDAFPRLVEPLLKYDYPFSLAWHGPIIPYTVLGGLALVWVADRLGAVRVDRWVRRLAYPVLLLALIALAAVVYDFDPLLTASKEQPRINFFGAFSSAADVDAMRWLHDNTPSDALVLNHPGPHEADWAAVISERDAVYFRPQPFFRGTQLAERAQNALRAFWNDPAGEDSRALLARYGVRYVLVPQVFANPSSFGQMLRWREPLAEAAEYLHSAVEQADYLRLVYDKDGAQVYEVIPPDASTDTP